MPKLHDIYNDTPLHPGIIADIVARDCAAFLDSSEPLAYGDRLEQRAIACYANNKLFRKSMKAAGNRGRDTLYAFMRHWLAGHMQRDHRALYRKLPSDYSRGAELPTAQGELT